MKKALKFIPGAICIVWFILSAWQFLSDEESKFLWGISTIYSGFNIYFTLLKWHQFSRDEQTKLTFSGTHIPEPLSPAFYRYRKDSEYQQEYVVHGYPAPNDNQMCIFLTPHREANADFQLFALDFGFEGSHNVVEIAFPSISFYAQTKNGKNLVDETLFKSSTAIVKKTFDRSTTVTLILAVAISRCHMPDEYEATFRIEVVTRNSIGKAQKQLIHATVLRDLKKTTLISDY